MRSFSQVIFLLLLGVNIVNAQHFGIGTLEPSHTLHVVPDQESPNKDPLRVDSLQYYTGANDSTILVCDPQTGIVRYMPISEFQSVAVDLEWLRSEDGYIYARRASENGSLFSVDDQGNLGLGIADPEYKLDVLGKIQFAEGPYSSRIIQDSYITTIDGSADFKLNTARGGGLFIATTGKPIRYTGIDPVDPVLNVPASIQVEYGNYFGFQTIGATGYYAAITNFKSPNMSWRDSGLIFNSMKQGKDSLEYDTFERMRITPEGSIAIGTKDPKGIFHVLGDKDLVFTRAGHWMIGTTDSSQSATFSGLRYSNELQNFGLGTNLKISASQAVGLGADIVISDSHNHSVAIGTNIATSDEHQLIMGFSNGYKLFTGSSTGVELAAGGGSWASISDKNLKENFLAIDRQQLLEKLVSLDISEWNYISQSDYIRHMGPMAQDFHAAFGLAGDDNTHITGSDIDGVNMAAIQALYEQVQTLKVKIEGLEAENNDLRANNTKLLESFAAIDERMRMLEARMDKAAEITQ